jgi:alpha-L-fucosidase
VLLPVVSPLDGIHPSHWQINIGPRADGSITVEERATLLAIGEWLKINGDAMPAKPVGRYAYVFRIEK